MPTPQNGQTHSNNLLATVHKLLSMFDHFVGLVLKGLTLTWLCQCCYGFSSKQHDANATKVMMSGYGVELAVKSTEYKAVDDQKVEDKKKSEKIQKDEDVGEDEVEGFLFQRLRFDIKNFWVLSEIIFQTLIKKGCYFFQAFENYCNLFFSIGTAFLKWDLWRSVNQENYVPLKLFVVV